MELASGQRKNMKSERVVLSPGPANEIATINFVYERFLGEKMSLAAIAKELNARGIPNACGAPWSPIAVRQLLSNEKYIGNAVYNRGSKKLGGKWRRNPPREWARKAGAYEAVVPAERFLQAKHQLKENANGYTDNEMLDHLTAIWCRERYLSRDIVDACPHSPSTNSYRQHFGTLANAFRQVGFTSARLPNHLNLQGIRSAICLGIAARVPCLDRVLPGHKDDGLFLEVVPHWHDKGPSVFPHRGQPAGPHRTAQKTSAFLKSHSFHYRFCSQPDPYTRSTTNGRGPLCITLRYAAACCPFNSCQASISQLPLDI